MNHKAIKAIADALCLFVAELKKEGRPPASLTIPHAEWKTFTLKQQIIHFRRRETLDALIAFRESFSERKAWRAKWSEKYLDSAESDLVGAAIDDPSEDAVLTATTRAVECLEREAPKFTVVLPIARLFLGKMRLVFPDIKLHTITAARQRRIRSMFFRIVESTPHNKVEKERLRGEIVEMTTLLLNQPCAEVIVRTDPDKAQAEAERRVAPILDFLQLASVVYEPPERGIRIRTGGDLLTKQPITLVIASDESSIHTMNRFLFDFRFEMNANRLASLKKSGFRAILDALAKSEEERTDFEKRMLTSMHWIADGSRQELLENKITSFITSIETFFTSDGGGNPLSRDLAEGSAMILSSNLKNRLMLSETIGELYRLRNKISHAGEKIENDKAERQLREISVNLLALIGKIPKKFNNIKEFRDWLKERRLS
ncbi:MAG TPA: hypothetical protein VMD91_15125 [Candidatus Sulfotelmatobacter sp.]|nr:hypothetical protein [Candidatus Sulfotelmatobacter sp.]